MRSKKRILFHGEAIMYENGQKQTKKKFTLTDLVCSNCARLTYETNTLFKTNYASN